MKRNSIKLQNEILFLFITLRVANFSHVFLTQLYYLKMAKLAATFCKTHYICEK